MQEGKPISYASKSLTPSECDYAQIEKELFAIVFGCKRFHHYIYGWKVTVQSDHKPLIPFFTKPLHAAPPRLQRMLLQLANYDLDVVYIPGTKIPWPTHFLVNAYQIVTPNTQRVCTLKYITLLSCAHLKLQARWNPHGNHNWPRLADTY